MRSAAATRAVDFNILLGPWEMTGTRQPPAPQTVSSLRMHLRGCHLCCVAAAGLASIMGVDAVGSKLPDKHKSRSQASIARQPLLALGARYGTTFPDATPLHGIKTHFVSGRSAPAEQLQSAGHE